MEYSYAQIKDENSQTPQAGLNTSEDMASSSKTLTSYQDKCRRILILSKTSLSVRPLEAWVGFGDMFDILLKRCKVSVG